MQYQSVTKYASEESFEVSYEAGKGFSVLCNAYNALWVF